MLTASFKTEFIDLQIDGLTLSRSYDSRSTYSGLFGFGWCSTLDTELIQTNRGFNIRECGTRKPATADLKPKLENNSYVVKQNDGVLLRFALDNGRLTGLQSPGHTEVQILRARRNLPRRDATGEGDKRNQVLLELDDSGRVIRIEAATRADFLYGPEGNLLSTKNAWSNTYNYKYDRLHNLTEVAYPDNTKETLTYDTDFDRVTSFQGRNSCKEIYRHFVEENTPKKKQLSQLSIATLTCPHLAPRETRFEFKFKKRQDNRWALANLSLTRDGKTQKTQFRLGGLK